MKEILVELLKWILKKLSRTIVWKYRPGIIGITGSVGKTSAKLAIVSVLGSERKIRFSQASHNNEIGFPLGIIGEWSEKELELVSLEKPPGVNKIRKIIFWSKVILTGVWQVILKKPDFPEMLVLEYGADRPGDIKYLLSIARPNVSVVTAIGDVPAHVEYYQNPKEVAREKARLLEYLPSAGFAILNADDSTVMSLKDRTRAHLMTYGFDKDADLRISSFENRTLEGKPNGISFKFEYGGSMVPVRLQNVFGKTHAYAAGAAACVGIIFGLNIVKAAEALKNYRPASHRVNLLQGIKDTFIIDDSYNANPLSMQAGLHTLADLPGKRKVAVLGDMLEIGKYAMEAHERIGKTATKFVELLITVGPRGKFIAEGARKSGLDRRRIKSFDSAEEVARVMPDLVRKGDLILIKASRAIHLEEVVEAIKI